MDEQDLLISLNEGEAKNFNGRDKACQVCIAIDQIENPLVKEVLTRAAGGTIGRDKLAGIMKSHGYDVGKRHLVRHRQEGHRS